MIILVRPTALRSRSHGIKKKLGESKQGFKNLKYSKSRLLQLCGRPPAGQCRRLSEMRWSTIQAVPVADCFQLVRAASVMDSSSPTRTRARVVPGLSSSLGPARRAARSRWPASSDGRGRGIIMIRRRPPAGAASLRVRIMSPTTITDDHQCRKCHSDRRCQSDSVRVSSVAVAAAAV